MAYNVLDYDSEVPNVGQKYGIRESLGRIQKVILTPKNFSFADQSTAETQSNWQDAIEQIANRIFPLPYVYENEDQSEDPVYQDFASGVSVLVRPGKYAERMHLLISVFDANKLAKFDGKEWRAFEVDEYGNILGTSPDGTVFKGFDVATFEVEKTMRTTGDANRTKPIYIKYKNPSEWNEDGVALRPLELNTSPWDPRELDGLTDVEITVDDQTTSDVDVTLKAYKKGVLLSGFDQTSDWVIKDDTDSTVSVSGVTDNGDGTYVITASLSAGTYTIDLADPATLSQDGFESTGSKEFTTS
jgi:hypothetical protein